MIVGNELIKPILNKSDTLFHKNMIFQPIHHHGSISVEGNSSSTFGAGIKKDFQVFRNFNRCFTAHIGSQYTDTVIGDKLLTVASPEHNTVVNLVIFIIKLTSAKIERLDLYLLLCRIGKYAQWQNHCENQKNCKKSFHFNYSFSSCLIAKKFYIQIDIIHCNRMKPVLQDIIYTKYIRKYDNFAEEYNVVYVSPFCKKGHFSVDFTVCAIKWVCFCLLSVFPVAGFSLSSPAGGGHP